MLQSQYDSNFTEKSRSVIQVDYYVKKNSNYKHFQASESCRQSTRYSFRFFPQKVD